MTGGFKFEVVDGRCDLPWIFAFVDCVLCEDFDGKDARGREGVFPDQQL